MTTCPICGRSFDSYDRQRAHRAWAAFLTNSQTAALCSIARDTYPETWRDRVAPEDACPNCLVGLMAAAA